MIDVKKGSGAVIGGSPEEIFADTLFVLNLIRHQMPKGEEFLNAIIDVAKDDMAHELWKKQYGSDCEVREVRTHDTGRGFTGLKKQGEQDG